MLSLILCTLYVISFALAEEVISTSSGWIITYDDSKMIANKDNIQRNIPIYIEDNDENDDRLCPEEFSMTFLSIVGDLVSYEESYFQYCDGMAHPNTSVHFRTYDLTKGTHVDLRTWYTEKQIFAGLLSDGFIQKHLTGQPQSLKEYYDMVPNLCEADLTDVVDSFAFHHITENQVAIRIGLPAGCQALGEI